ncbi:MULTISPECIES: acetoin utilization protein AcuC [Micrococcus]|nr:MULTISPECIES: acetoin utilization protein AcuC [Micrococcus]OFR88500.1 acetoin utilization protein AcuC [Micrococcus sp. HMSC067E09]PNL18582.1 acetoin utilization protein AcuC [Micrococcus sp. FDAARGOS_333]TFH98948.1 acetoin utilization protein AcuC [Micrococcus lylae]
MSATSSPSDSQPAAVVWHSDLLKYRFSAEHPMAPLRLDLTHRLIESFDLLSGENVRIIEPPVATDEQLQLAHAPEYIAAVKAASSGGTEDEEHGLGSEDCPIFPDLHESAARIAGGTLAAAEAVWSGEVRRAVNFSGGMHHASRKAASGFCIYNDCAVAIQRLLDLGAERIAYVDVDAHHGDGTQSIFYNDPRVLTISIHETGFALFPGTGFANEVGGPEALGSAANVAVPARTGDAGFLRATHATVPQLLRAFAPQVLVTQHGCDSHHADPLADLRLSVDGQRQLAFDLADWADQFCQGRWIATGGGGYNPLKVVPRAWAHLTAIVLDAPIPIRAEIPQAWVDHVTSLTADELTGDMSSAPEDEEGRIPTTMGEGADVWWRSWEVGYDPSDPVDQAIMATRKELFPYHGLDPWFD